MSYQVNLYILSNLTSYIPKCDNITSKWDNILKLSLADPSSDSVIDLILGADVYPFIVLLISSLLRKHLWAGYSLVH